MAKSKSVRLASGVKLSITREYKTSDGRKCNGPTAANRVQTAINREAAIKNVIREFGLTYKSNPSLLSIGPLASYLANGTLLEKLYAAANSRRPRHRPRATIIA
jgi:hypothetical protein